MVELYGHVFFLLITILFLSQKIENPKKNSIVFFSQFLSARIYLSCQSTCILIYKGFDKLLKY